jgi:hypothetical protein
MPTDSQLHQITTKREKLLERVEEFQAQCSAYFPALEKDHIAASEDIVVAVIDDDDEGAEPVSDGEEVVDNTNLAEAADLAESFLLWMPSAAATGPLTPTLTEAKAIELKLRIGQANECLENIRLTLGRLSFLYKMQHGQTSITKTRNRRPIADCRKIINHHVWLYSHTRLRLQKLGLSADELCTKYQPILKSHLSVSKDVTEEARHSQKSDKLAWFWKLEVNNANSYDSWDLEGMVYKHLINVLL